MSETPTQDGSGTSGLKLAAIAILSVLLIGVLYVQFGGDQKSEDSDGEQVAVDEPAPGRQRSRRAPRPNTAATESPSATTTWPALGLAEILQHNPFGLPHSLTENQPPSPDEAADESDEELERQREEERQRLAKQEEALGKLQKSGMTIYFADQHGSAAIIGSRRVRPGDNIEGFRVVDVQPDGVVLESVDAKQ